jgi:hypothetical protein
LCEIRTGQQVAQILLGQMMMMMMMMMKIMIKIGLKFKCPALPIIVGSFSAIRLFFCQKDNGLSPFFQQLLL